MLPEEATMSVKRDTKFAIKREIDQTISLLKQLIFFVFVCLGFGILSRTTKNSFFF